MAARAQQSSKRMDLIRSGQELMVVRGYSAVGLSEILAGASVPKGSFYHWFPSRDDFGHAIVESYFDGYLARVDALIATGNTPVERFHDFWTDFRVMQSFNDGQGQCLAIKLGAEVSDLSESMRAALVTGTEKIIDRIADLLEAGLHDGTMTVPTDARATARTLYDLWVGASTAAKINHSVAPLDNAFTMTCLLVGLDLYSLH